MPDRATMMRAAAEPTALSPEAESFYAEALRELSRLGLPFLLAGTYAVSAYTGITRVTKDLDIFCRPGDYPRILTHFKDLDHQIEIEDDRWIGKVYKNQLFFDVIFAAANGTMPVVDEWFKHAKQTAVFGVRVHIIGPTELVWSRRSSRPAPAMTGPTWCTSCSSSMRTSIGDDCSRIWICTGKCC